MPIWNIAFSEFLNGLATNCINDKKLHFYTEACSSCSEYWKETRHLNEIFLYSYMKVVCLSESVLWLQWFHQLSSVSQAWTRLAADTPRLNLSNTIMNFVWHFPYSAPCPVAQISAKHRPEGYRFSIHAYAGWISVNIQQNQFGCLQESSMWANCPGFSCCQW